MAFCLCLSPPLIGGVGLDLKGEKGPRARSVERGGAGGKPAEWVAEAPFGRKGAWRVACLLEAALGGAQEMLGPSQGDP